MEVLRRKVFLSLEQLGLFFGCVLYVFDACWQWWKIALKNWRRLMCY
jgi:hypothetical protein